MSGAQDYQAIVDAADKQHAALQALERQIDSKIDEIKDREWNRPLTAEERTTLAGLRADMSSVMSAMVELAYVTLGALDKTDEVQRLINALASASKELSARKASLSLIASGLQSFAETLNGIERLVAHLKKYLPK